VALGKLPISTIERMPYALQDWIASRGGRVRSKQDNPLDSVAEIIFEDAKRYGGQIFRLEIRELVT